MGIKVKTNNYQKMSHIATKKLEYVKGLDGNKEELSQLEGLIFNRFKEEAFDDSVKFRHFKKLVYTDFIQEMQSIAAKTDEIRQNIKNQENTFDTNS